MQLVRLLGNFILMVVVYSTTAVDGRPFSFPLHVPFPWFACCHNKQAGPGMADSWILISAPGTGKSKNCHLMVSADALSIPSHCVSAELLVAKKNFYHRLCHLN